MCTTPLEHWSSGCPSDVATHYYGKTSGRPILSKLGQWMETLFQMAKFDRTTGGQSCSFPSVWQCGKVTGSQDEFLYPIRT